MTGGAGGEGVKTITEKLPTLGRGVSKICKKISICSRMVPY